MKKRKGEEEGKVDGEEGAGKEAGKEGRLCWGALPFQDLLGWFSIHCTSSWWRACFPLLSSGAHSLSSETVPETFQEHPAEPVVPASQDTGEKLNLFLASRGTGMGWWAWQMRLWQEILQTLRRQGKVGVGGWAVLGWVIHQKTWGTGEHECDFLRSIPRKNEWGDGERDQEEKEASQGRNINQSPPWSLAQPCRDALGSTEVTSQDCPDQALGHPEESLMKGCPLGTHLPGTLPLRCAGGFWQMTKRCRSYSIWGVKAHRESVCTRVVKAEAGRPPSLLVYWVERWNLCLPHGVL